MKKILIDIKKGLFTFKYSFKFKIGKLNMSICFSGAYIKFH